MAERIKDKDLIYDEVRKRYRLTKDYVKNELGIDLQVALIDETDTNPTTLPERTLKYTSNMIYDYMKRNCADYNYACELIETVPEIHEAFKDALGYQLMSFATEGDNAFSAGGSIEKSIGERTMQILLGYKLLTVQRPRRGGLRSLLWDIQDEWADMGGGVF